MTKLTKTAIASACLALLAAIFIPMYVTYEHSEALAHEQNMLAKSMKARSAPPSITCADDHIRITDYSRTIPISIPVMGNKGIVQCDSTGYSINDKVISEEVMNNIAYRTLMKDRENEQNRKNENSTSFGPTIDYGYLLKTLNQALEYNNISNEQRVRLLAIRDSLIQ